MFSGGTEGDQPNQMGSNGIPFLIADATTHRSSYFKRVK